MPKPTAHFRCFRGCAGAWPLTQAIYRCPTCDGLLEVAHDRAALAQTSADEWRARFDARWSPTAREIPMPSGVWSKREWVAPEVPDDCIVSTGEGMTALYPAKLLAKQSGIRELYVKQCGTTHTGSFKDLGMTVLVSVVNQAVRQGSLKVRAIACASTGDTSAALAAYGAAAGLPVVVLLPRGMVSVGQLVQPLAHGARVLALDTDFDGCMRIVRELAARGLVYLANSMNPLRIEGQKTVAIEIAQQLGWQAPDWVVIPSGNLGNAAALYAGFAMARDLGLVDRLPRLCVAQAANADPMYRAFMKGQTEVTPVVAKATQASAIRIGNPVSAPRAMAALKAMNGVVEEATEQELADACAKADRTGLYACPHTGVGLACAMKLRARGVIAESERVVVVSTASALKFTEFKLGYHEKKLPEVDSTLANEPIALPADVETVVQHLPP
ncbi:Threonine synthase [Labilithrix luteola]|uniref:Threonine synthase n=1 Tax=Labilithrix luteola TaxID=1391654 RepID=A0A0K1QAF9_9BACT|nr:threonine synthase [Labilithrix luteola]AKV02771.1 Threonine synthase [Labilithrix luteola]